MTQSPQLSLFARRAAGQAIGDLMKVGVEHPDCLSLAAGFVDESGLPADLIRSSVCRILNGPDRQAVLQYGTTPGTAAVRSVFLRHLARLEDNPDVDRLSPDRIVLTTGSQQLLCLLTQALFEPGDICLVAAPTYFVYLGVLEAVGARVIPVPTDEDGLHPDGLEQTLQRLDAQGDLPRVRLVYAVSYYDNPAGVSIAANRREQIVRIVCRWADRCPVRLLEDAAYRELHYDGPELNSLWSYDESGQNVILTQTFSKSFSPGLRVGFSVLPDDLVRPVCDLKANEDFGSPRFSQAIMADILEQGSAYADHVQQIRNRYRIRRDAMLAAADEYFSSMDGVSWQKPDGGLYVWMTLPESVPTGFDSPLFTHAVEACRVIYVPGELCYPSTWNERPANRMRLSFGVLPPEQIREGMRRLAQAVRDILEQSA